MCVCRVSKAEQQVCGLNVVMVFFHFLSFLALRHISGGVVSGLVCFFVVIPPSYEYSEEQKFLRSFINSSRS